MPLKRSKDQIIAQILELCQGDGVSKTRIVYQINLNFHSVNIYLDILIKKGCIESNQGDRTIYKTTSKGKNALVILKKAREIYS
jgi:predicted transcriptional regulator